MKFSNSTGQFYPDSLTYPTLPDDIISVTKEDYDLAMARSPGDTLDVVDGRIIVIKAQEPSASQILDMQLVSYEKELDRYLDSVAQSYRYADRTRLALRASYPNQHQSLAAAFGTWMDTCNDLAKQRYIDVKAGADTLPPLDDFIALLPPFVAP